MIIGTFGKSNIIQVPDLGFADLHIEANDAVAVNTLSYSQTTYVYPWQTQWWSATITFPPMDRKTIAPWQAFLLELQGPTNVFLLSDPDEAYPLGSVTAASTLTLGSIIANNQISVAGFPVSQNGLFLPGDNIQIGYRLYKITEPVNSDANGNGTLSIFPYLRDNPAIGTGIIFNNCQGLFRLIDNKRSWGHSPTAAWGLDALHCMEAL